ncbi:MAG: SRPBCC domain-containing protein [Bacteroidota bacterium]
MSTQKFIHNEIEIQASAEEIWDALTHPAKTQQYMYNCEALSTWKEGDELLWKGAQDGVVYVKGRVVIFDPEKTLAYTVFDPNGTYPDIPENYLTVTMTLEDREEGILLKVSQGDYSQVANGADRYEDTLDQGGWQSVIQGIKRVVEGE